MLFIPQEAVEHGGSLGIWVRQRKVQIPVERVTGCDPPPVTDFSEYVSAFVNETAKVGPSVGPDKVGTVLGLICRENTQNQSTAVTTIATHHSFTEELPPLVQLKYD